MAYNPEVEDLTSRLEVKEADIQRAVLFSVYGDATYKLIKNFLPKEQHCSCSQFSTTPYWAHRAEAVRQKKICQNKIF